MQYHNSELLINIKRKQEEIRQARLHNYIELKHQLLPLRLELIELRRARKLEENGIAGLGGYISVRDADRFDTEARQLIEQVDRPTRAYRPRGTRGAGKITVEVAQELELANDISEQTHSARLASERAEAKRLRDLHKATEATERATRQSAEHKALMDSTLKRITPVEGVYDEE